MAFRGFTLSKIAEMDSTTHRVRLISPTTLRYRCLRCAALCCLLGGPVVSRKDVERLNQIHPHQSDWLVEMRVGGIRKSSLRSKPTGECVFLQRRRGEYSCSVYDCRPKVCRFFPFVLKRRNQFIELFVLPCRGLNDREGIHLDEGFVRNLVTSALTP